MDWEYPDRSNLLGPKFKAKFFIFFYFGLFRFPSVSVKLVKGIQCKGKMNETKISYCKELKEQAYLENISNAHKQSNAAETH